MICRCRLVKSTVSSSTRVIFPSPAESKVKGCRGTKATGPDDQGVARQDAGLPLDTDGVEQDVAAVAEKLVVVHSGLCWAITEVRPAHAEKSVAICIHAIPAECRRGRHAGGVPKP